MSLQSRQLCDCRLDMLNIAEQLRDLLWNFRSRSFAYVSRFIISSRPNINQLRRWSYDVTVTDNKKFWIWVFLKHEINTVYLYWICCLCLRAAAAARTQPSARRYRKFIKYYFFRCFRFLYCFSGTRTGQCRRSLISCVFTVFTANRHSQ